MSSQVHDLHTFMAQASSDMASEYARIFARASEDPGTAGDEGEGNWAAFLGRWLPAGYHVRTKGRLLAADGRMSKQIDAVVLKPSYPPGLLDKKVWLAAGVAAVFECKTTLTAAHVIDSMTRCSDFKGLYEKREGSPRVELTSPLIYGVLAHSHSWKSKGSKPIENVNKALLDGSAKVSEPQLAVDLLCVADLASWSSQYIAMYRADWRPDASAALQAIFGGPVGPLTAYMCSRKDGNPPEFQPVGALIASLTNRLAWDDEPLRGIAEYYMAANLLGSGQGDSRPWPLSVYSTAVSKRVVAGQLSNGIRWDDWALSVL